MSRNFHQYVRDGPEKPQPKGLFSVYCQVAAADRLPESVELNALGLATGVSKATTRQQPHLFFASPCLALLDPVFLFCSVSFPFPPSNTSILFSNAPRLHAPVASHRRIRKPRPPLPPPPPSPSAITQQLCWAFITLCSHIPPKPMMAMPRRGPRRDNGIFTRFIRLGRTMSSSPPHPDFVSLNINRYDDGSLKASEPREIPGFDGLFWTLRVYPLGRDPSKHNGYCDVFLHVSGGPIRVKATVILDETKKILDEIFQAEDELGFPDFCLTSHLRLLPGENQFNCIVAFESVSDPALWVPRPYEFVDESKDNTWDTEFIVGDDRVKVHRGFLSMTSPVFDAEFNNATGKENTNTVTITDFPFETVKNSVDYIYGHDLGAKTPAEIVDVLRFVRKYSIDTAITKLEAWLLLNITPDTFPLIAKYAWEYKNAEMQAECSRFYAQNVEQLKNLNELESSIITGIESFKL